MAVEVLNETETQIDLTEFAQLAEYVMREMHVSTDSELTIIFIEEEPMADLHVRWLDLEGPTDVMSFPMDELKPGRPDAVTPEGSLGDICICPSIAEKQALAAGHSAEEEMLLLATHGILHLLGFDHAEADEEEVMFSLQRRLLLTFLAQQ